MKCETIFKTSVLVALLVGMTACGGSDNNSNDPVLSSTALPTASPTAIPTISPTVAPAVTFTPTSTPTPTLTPTPEVSQQPVDMVSTRINGSILGFSSTGDEIKLESDDITVRLNLLDDTEKVVAKMFAEPTVNLVTGTNALRFNADLEGANATTLAVDVSVPGYTTFSRRLDIEDVLYLDAKLQKVEMEAVSQSMVQTASGRMVEGFNYSVMEMKNGEEVEAMSISIPMSLLPENTESLSVAVKTFDPNDPVDAEYFPGAYADSDGQRLVSVAFNYTEVETNSGEPLISAMSSVLEKRVESAHQRGVLMDDQEPVVINRVIPDSSCATLSALGDSADNIDGFQVPVYTYNPNSGLWDLLGQGTVYSDTGNMVSADQSSFVCDTQTYTLEILVTNEIFLSKWWNLDYPLLFDEPQTYCATIQLRNEDNEVLAGVPGFVWDNDENFSFSAGYFTTDDNGIATVEVVQTNGSTDLNAEILIYDFASDEGFSRQTISLSDNCDDAVAQMVILDRPKQCEVLGNVSYTDGLAAESHLVFALSSDNVPFSFDFATTDNDGNFRLNLQCGGSYEVSAYSALIFGQDEDVVTKVSTLDSVVAEDELSDNGSVVELTPFSVEYVEPIVLAFGVPENNMIDGVVYGSTDSFPLTYSLQVMNNEQTEVLTTLNGVFDSTLDTGDEGQFVFFSGGEIAIDYTFPASPQRLVGQFTIRDALGNTWEPEPFIIRF